MNSTMARSGFWAAGFFLLWVAAPVGMLFVTGHLGALTSLLAASIGLIAVTAFARSTPFAAPAHQAARRASLITLAVLGVVLVLGGCLVAYLAAMAPKIWH